MKKVIREIIAFSLYIYSRLTSKLPKISSIYFHDPSPQLFEIILRWYKKHNYRFISLADLEHLLQLGEEPTDRVAYISFDDGNRSNMDLIPLCEKYNVPITVFVATEPLLSGNYWWEYATAKLGHSNMLEMKKMPEKEFYAKLKDIKQSVKIDRTSMTIEELLAFSQHPLVTIQSHTVNHPILTNSSPSTLYSELKESKRILEEITGATVDVFSYPNGDVGSREIKALIETGYKYAFTTKGDQFKMSEVNHLLLPRMAMNTNGGKYDNLAKLTGIWYRVRNTISI